MVTVSLLPMLPATAENDALVDPPGTVTDDGTVNGALFANLIDTVAPLLGAAADNVTVHTAEACETSAAGLQVSELAVGGAGGGGGGGGGANCRAKLWDVPLSAATRVTVVVAVTAADVAPNVALVVPCATVTEAGTLTPVVAPAVPSATSSPPLGAGADTVTVQDAVPGVVSGFGEQASAVTL
jgi:hypothetical protein